MKKFLAAVLFLTVMLQIPAFAASAPKIGVVNRAEVLKKSEPGAAALAKLKAQSETMRADLERQKKDLDKMREDLQKQGMVLSMEAKQEKDIQFKRKVRDFQDTQSAYEQKMKTAEAQALEPVWKMLTEIIQTYAKKNEYTTILEKNDLVILYVDPAVDLNAAITQELNSAWKAKGGK